RRVLLFVRPRSVIALFPVAETCMSADPIQPFPRSWKSLRRRRRDQSRPSEASRRVAWTGVAEAVRLKTREWRSWRLLSSRVFQSRLRFYSHCPDETEQLSADSGDNLGLVFTSSRQVFVAFVQPALGFPGDGLDFRIQLQRLLPFQEIATD